MRVVGLERRRICTWIYSFDIIELGFRFRVVEFDVNVRVFFYLFD